MRTITMRKTWVALALVASILACKGESPTAPTPGSGGNPPPGGGNPPPAGTAVTLTVSNADPLVDSTVTATATVTVDGQPAPNGTAVEFTVTGGSFGAEGQSIVRTTTSGAAAITLTSTTAGPVSVRAIVNNIIRTATITFRARPVVEPPPSTAPAITSITPAVGRPSGGETVLINGRNFRTPIRVIFRTEDGQSREVPVISATSTQIEVMSPGINLGAGQQLAADIIVFTEAGTANEIRLERAGAFTFRNTQLTPRISTVTPNSGPITGGTRVEIFGDGFQAPVQVLFGTAEARVISVDYARIEVETPAGRDTNPDGSGAVLGPVPVVVRNISSQTDVSLSNAFNYKSAVEVIAVGPTEGPSTGGTEIEIIGHGFVAPVTVSVAGVAAQPIFVSGTKIIAITSPVDIEGCADVSGPVIVTNLQNADSDEGVEFTYDALEPTIIGVSPNEVVEGGAVTITVANATSGVNRIRLGDRTVFASGTIDNTTGIGVFTVVTPTNIEFDTETCTGAGGLEGEREIPSIFDVTFEAVDSGCEDTATDALTIIPTDTSCALPPAPNVVTVPVPGSCIVIPAATVGGAETQGTFTVTNTGTASLSINGAISGPAAADYALNLPSFSVAPGASQVVIVRFNPSAAGTRTATINLSTNDPDTPSVPFCLNATGNP
jgi:hypothetical protein